MATSFTHVLIVGGCMSRHPTPGSKTYIGERGLLQALADQLPSSWQAGVGGNFQTRVPGIFFTIPYRSKKEFAKVLAGFLAAVDREFEGFLANNFVVSDLGHRRESNGACIFDGNGRDLASQVRFWTGIDWTRVKPLRWRDPGRWTKVQDELVQIGA